MTSSSGCATTITPRRTSLSTAVLNQREVRIAIVRIRPELHLGALIASCREDRVIVRELAVKDWRTPATAPAAAQYLAHHHGSSRKPSHDPPDDLVRHMQKHRMRERHVHERQGFATGNEFKAVIRTPRPRSIDRLGADVDANV